MSGKGGGAEAGSVSTAGFNMFADRALAAYTSTSSAAQRAYFDANLAAKQELAPLTNTAQSAITQLRRFNGLPGEDPNLGISDFFQTQSTHYSARTDLDSAHRNMWGDMHSQYQMLKQADTQEEREEIRTQLLQQMDSTAQTFSGAIPIDPNSGFDQEQYEAGYFQQPVNGIRQYMQQVENMDLSDEGMAAPPPATGSEIAQEVLDRPGVSFRYEQGQKALARADAARGGLLSGAGLLRAQEFGQLFAATEFANENSRLMGLAGLTMPGIQQSSGISQQQGQQVASNYNLFGQNVGGVRMAQAGADLQKEQINAQLQTQASIANAQSKSAFGQQALGIGAKLLGGLF